MFIISLFMYVYLYILFIVVIAVFKFFDEQKTALHLYKRKRLRKGFTLTEKFEKLWICTLLMKYYMELQSH